MTKISLIGWRRNFIQVCREWFKEISKGEIREITINQQYQRDDIEVCRSWLFVDLYSLGEPLSQDEILQTEPRGYLINFSGKEWGVRGSKG